MEKLLRQLNMEIYENVHILMFFIYASSLLRARGQSQDKDQEQKIIAAEKAADLTFNSFLTLFLQCQLSRMPRKQFLIDDIQKFVNYPAKTTIGLAPKFTGNRKFFANMITTTAFKEMLEKDGEELWYNRIEKFKYCDEIVMDQELLKEFYDRELDPSKL